MNMLRVPAVQPADRIEALTAEHNATLARLAGAVAREIALTAERDYTEGTNDTLIALNQSLTADNARLREVVLEADKLLCGDLAGLQWKRECRSFLVLARAVLKGETHD